MQHSDIIPVTFINDSVKSIIIDFNHENFASHISEEDKHDLFLPINMQRRRSFHNDMASFCETMNYFFVKFPELANNYIHLYNRIKRGEFNESNKMDLVDYIDSLICKDYLVKEILCYVLENYTITIEDPKKDNKNMKFNDMYAKRIIAVGVLSRITLPLIFHYLSFNQTLRKDDSLTFEMVSKGFKYFDFDDNGNSINMQDKILDYVTGVVDKTEYSDKVIWQFLENLGTNPKIIAIGINRVIITTTIPKLQINKSIISYLSVVANKQLEFLFSKNFNIQLKPISIIKSDDDIASPLTRIENKILKNRSELELLIIDKSVEKYLAINNELIDKTLLDFYVENIQIHDSQTRLITFFLAKELGSEVHPSVLSREQYVKICLLAQIWYQYNGYPFIGWLILARRNESNYLRRNYRKGRLREDIISSKMYKSLVHDFTHLKDESIEELVTGFIGDIANLGFEEYEYPYGIYPNEKIFESSHVIAQLLDYIETL